MSSLISLLLFLAAFQVFSLPINSTQINQPTYTQITDIELLDYLHSKSVRLSGLKTLKIDELPPIYYLTSLEIQTEVCPEDPQNCRGLAAYFDDINYRIFILDELQLSDNFNPKNYSFAIHEIIHALQFAKDGPEIFKNCDAIFKTEKLAYLAQDKYLKEEGSFFKASVSLKNFYCDEDRAQQEYLKSKEAFRKKHKNSASIYRLKNFNSTSQTPVKSHT